MGVPKVNAPALTSREDATKRTPRCTFTKYGVFFLIVLAGMLLGSTNYHSNLGLAMTFLLGSMGLVSTLHTFRNLKGLEMAPGRAENVFAGETAEVAIWVRAVDRPRRAIWVQFENGPARVFNMEAGNPKRLNLKVTAGGRGPLDPGNLKVWTEYPYGLFRCRSDRRLAIRAWVYPRPAAGPLYGERQETGTDGRMADSTGREDFKGLRPYRQGDPFQHIAWKAAARGAGLLTKEFEGAKGRALMFDWDRMEPGDDEVKLSRICHQVLTAHQRNMMYGVRLPGGSIAPSAGENHLNHCLEALARYGLTVKA